MRRIVRAVFAAMLLTGYAVATGQGSSRAAMNAWPHVAVNGFSTPDGRGFWLTYADGSVTAQGSAKLAGDASGLALARPIVGGAVAPGASGYWLVASDGDYAKRIRATIDVREIGEGKGRTAAERMDREGQAILAAIPKGAHVIAFDPRGKTMTSEAFAALLGKLAEGGKTLTFLIGGADGLSDAVRKSADHMLSLGAMTWPHLMVRAMLAEQIYRAETILAGHPYHRA